MAQVVEIDAQTGEVIERDFTADELAQREADTKSATAEAKAKEKAETDAAAAREAAIAHAKSLGFTDAMIAVMYPGLAS